MGGDVWVGEFNFIDDAAYEGRHDGNGLYIILVQNVVLL